MGTGKENKVSRDRRADAKRALASKLLEMQERLEKMNSRLSEAFDQAELSRRGLDDLTLLLAEGFGDDPELSRENTLVQSTRSMIANGNKPGLQPVICRRAARRLEELVAANKPKSSRFLAGRRS